MTHSDKKFLAKLAQQYLKHRKGLTFTFSEIYQLIGIHKSRDEINFIDFCNYCQTQLQAAA